ncbi:MAG TPA: DUF4384 domain-containing protein [Acidobacteriota bacterium]|nr:DUF4384 domain-containing protein [Acidobacteriota bacterium]
MRLTIAALVLIGLPSVGVLCAQQQESQTVKSRDARIFEMYYRDTLVRTEKDEKASGPEVARPSAGAQSSRLEVPANYSEKLARRVGLKYKIKRCTGECTVEDVDQSHIFYTGDKIRLEIEANIDGYLYIINKGSTGRTKTLFPEPSLNGGTNLIQRGVSYSIPSEGWITFTKRPGREQVIIIVSRTPLQSLPEQASEAASTVSALQVVDELNRKVKARDLVIVRERGPRRQGAPPGVQSTLVVNKSAEENQLAYTEIVLQHRARPGRQQLENR